MENIEAFLRDYAAGALPQAAVDEVDRAKSYFRVIPHEHGYSLHILPVPKAMKNSTVEAYDGLESSIAALGLKHNLHARAIPDIEPFDPAGNHPVLKGVEINRMIYIATMQDQFRFTFKEHPHLHGIARTHRASKVVTYTPEVESEESAESRARVVVDKTEAIYKFNGIGSFGFHVAHSGDQYKVRMPIGVPASVLRTPGELSSFLKMLKP